MTTPDELSEPVESSSPDNNKIHSLLNELEGAQSGKTPLSLAVTETGYTETHQAKSLQAFVVAAGKIILALPDKGNPSTTCVQCIAVSMHVGACLAITAFHSVEASCNTTVCESSGCIRG